MSLGLASSILSKDTEDQRWSILLLRSPWLSLIEPGLEYWLKLYWFFPMMSNNRKDLIKTSVFATVSNTGIYGNILDAQQIKGFAENDNKNVSATYWASDARHCFKNFKYNMLSIIKANLWYENQHFPEEKTGTWRFPRPDSFQKLCS